MKSIIFAVLLVMLVSCAGAQGRMGEAEAIRESHIDFSTHMLYFVIHGVIEIDGHQFINDTSHHPIIYFANLDGITITDTASKVEYQHRVCGMKGCKIVHLVKKEPPKVEEPRYFFHNLTPTIVPDSNLLNNARFP